MNSIFNAVDLFVYDFCILNHSQNSVLIIQEIYGPVMTDCTVYHFNIG